MELNFSFLAINISIVKLFILILAGYLLYAFRVIDDKFTDMLSALLVRFVFPALILYTTITHFTFEGYPYWWILPLVGIVFSLAGILLGMLIYRVMGAEGSYKEFLCCATFQNCGYLPMNIILFSFSGEVREKFLIYLFLFLIGFNLLMWSLVPLFLLGKLKKGIRPSIFLNPPVVATVFSLLWVALFGVNTMPSILLDPIREIGNMAFPISMLILGAYLNRYKAYVPDKKAQVAGNIITKLAIFPIIVIIVLKFIPCGIDYKFFLFLEAIMPTAVSMIVVSSYTSSDSGFVSGSIFYSHIVAILSIPLWLMIFRIFIV